MIYLDYAAATPISKKAREAMEPYFSEQFFNPSSPYLPAKKVRADYEAAKDQIAHCIGAKGTDLVITAGATEANNLAFSIVEKKCLVLETEHDSVLKVAENYDHELIKVDKTGTVIMSDLKSKITDEVELISIALANNEIGTIQPLAEISQLIREIRQNRLKRGIKTPLYLHSDASQAMNLLDINVARLGTDLLTLNAAKVYGPKGVGALYVSHEVRLKPVTYGGGQERGLRSGTENVPGIIGFAAAFQEAKLHLNGNRKKYDQLRARFMEVMEKELSWERPEATAVRPLGRASEARDEGASPVTTGASDPSPKKFFSIASSHRLSNFCPIIFKGLDAERLIYKLEEEEIYVSTGAACAASKGQKSKTLLAIGLTEEEISGSLRITFGAQTTEEEVKKAAKVIAEKAREEYARK